MSDNTNNIGPDFLEALADRCEAQGFGIETNMLRENARAWSRERQGLPPPAAPTNTAGKRAGVVSGELVDLSLERKRVTFVFTSGEANPFPDLGARRYHLLPAAH